MNLTHTKLHQPATCLYHIHLQMFSAIFYWCILPAYETCLKCCTWTWPHHFCWPLPQTNAAIRFALRPLRIIHSPSSCLWSPSNLRAVIPLLVLQQSAGYICWPACSPPCWPVPPPFPTFSGPATTRILLAKSWLYSTLKGCVGGNPHV